MGYIERLKTDHVGFKLSTGYNLNTLTFREVNKIWVKSDKIIFYIPGHWKSYKIFYPCCPEPLVEYSVPT